MLLWGDTTRTRRLWLRPQTTNFTTITTPTTLQLQTSLVNLHCFQTLQRDSSPELFGRCDAARHSGEERGPEDFKIRALLVTLQREQRHTVAVSSSPLPLVVSLFMVSLLMCPVRGFLFSIRSGTVPVRTTFGGQDAEGVFFQPKVCSKCDWQRKGNVFLRSWFCIVVSFELSWLCFANINQTYQKKCWCCWSLTSYPLQTKV